MSCCHGNGRFVTVVVQPAWAGGRKALPGHHTSPWFRLVIDLSWQSGAAFHSPFLYPFSTVSSFFLVLSLSLFLSAQRAGCITVGWNATIGPGLLRSSFWLPLALFACLRHVYAVRTMCLSASFVMLYICYMNTYKIFNLCQLYYFYYYFSLYGLL